MKYLQLKDIVPYIFYFENVEIWQGDVYNDPKAHEDDNWEKIYSGSAMDIPWYMMKYYLTNTNDAEAISTYGVKGGKGSVSSCLSILVCERKNIVKQYMKGELN